MQAAEQQPRAEEEHDAERDLAHHEPGAQTSRGSRRGGRGTLANGAREVPVEQADRRSQAEEYRGGRGGGHGENEHVQIEVYLAGARHHEQAADPEQARDRAGEGQPRRQTRQGQDGTLGQELSRETQARGAQAGPQRHLTLPRLSAGQEQPGHVGASHEQQQQGGPGQQEQRGPHGARDLVLHGKNERPRPGLHGDEAVFLPALRESAKLGVGLHHRRAGPELGCGIPAVAAAVGLGRVHGQGQP